MRLNLVGGGVRVVEVLADEWSHGLGFDDVAVAPLPEAENDVGVDCISIAWQPWAATERMLMDLHVGIGDDILMLGRLSDFDGGATNRPVARFGSISRMSDTPSRNADGNEVSVFLVEMRSLSGFSGSPVFCVIPPGAWRAEGAEINIASGRMVLLGIDVGHIRFTTPVIDSAGEAHKDGWKVQEHSGISMVVPAWRIEKVFTSTSLADTVASMTVRAASGRTPAGDVHLPADSYLGPKLTP